MARPIELVLGILTGAVGLVGWVYALFGPVYLSSTGDRASIAETSLNPTSAAFFAVMMLSILGGAFGTYRHRQQRGARWRAVLWTSTLVLVGGTILSGFSVGLFFLPSALLAVAAAVAGSFVPSQDSWL